MGKFNIEKDLLKTLKDDKKNLLYNVVNMMNNTYNYQIDYLNEIPYNELIIHLEKIITIGNKRKKINNLKDFFNGVISFNNNIDNIKYEDLINDKVFNFKYWLKLKIAKFQNEFDGRKISSLLLAGLIFFNFVVKKDVKNIKEFDNEEENYLIQNELVLNEEEKKAIKLYEEENIFYNDNYQIMNASNTDILVKEEKLETFVRETTQEEKIFIILDKFNLTNEEFNVLCAIVLAEAKANSYEDAYAVINTIYNRSLSKAWNYSAENYFGTNTELTLYHHATLPNQFVVYQEGAYKSKLNIKEGVAYQAIIDFLYTEEIYHYYLSFRANYVNVKNSESFTDGGNNYFNELKNEDRIDIDYSR